MSLRTAPVTAVLFLGAIFLGVDVCHAAFVHDYSSEFSTTNNPNSVWEYDGVPTSQLNSTKTVGVFDSGFGAWRGTAGDTYNLMFQGAFHPGQFSDDLIGFDYPDLYSASVAVHISFFDAQAACGGSGTTVSLWVNNTHLQDIAIPDTFSGNIVTDLNVSLSPGEIFYVRQAHNGGNNACNNCGINALTFTSTATPEPGCLGFLGMTGAAVLARRRRV